MHGYEAVIYAPNLEPFDWLIHGFGLRNSSYPAEIETVKQIHSDMVLEAPGDPGREGDALITNQAGVIAGMRTADCVPILLADPETRSIGSIHAGWRGTAGDIVGKAVAAMASKWGARAENLHAAIGPSIGPCCYEVGPEVAHCFGIESARSVYLDLPRENEQRLRAAGVRNIWKSGECTFCAAHRFFSYRREREQAGRMISFAGIRA